MFVSVCIVKLSVRLSFIAQCVCVRSMIKMMYVCIYGYMFTYVHMDTCVRLIRLLGRVQLRSTMMPSMAVISWVRLPWQQQSGDAAASAAVTALPGALGALRLIKKNKKTCIRVDLSTPPYTLEETRLQHPFHAMMSCAVHVFFMGQMAQF